MDSLFTYGVVEEPLHASPEISCLLQAVQDNRDFEFLEIRTVLSQGDTLVFVCRSEEIGNKNKVGIRSREPIAVTFRQSQEDGIPYSVRALRPGFPITMHQNGVASCEPPSLCLYLESWDVLERTWTPEAFLRRIQWWLVTASRGEFQTSAQPIEQLFFKSPITVVLPKRLSSSDQLSFSLSRPRLAPQEGKEFFVRCSAVGGNGIPSCFVIETSAIVEGPIFSVPRTLAELEAQLETRGSGILSALLSAIVSIVPPSGLAKRVEDVFWENRLLLILSIPVYRAQKPEWVKNDRRGFLISIGTLELGVAGGELIRDGQGLFYRDYRIGEHRSAQAPCLESIEICSVEILEPLDRTTMRAMSAIEPDSSEMRGILTGVGALGGSLANIWGREGWGIWTLVDHDYLRPHNLCRHSSTDAYVGTPKSFAVANHMNSVFPHLVEKHTFIAEKANALLETEGTEFLEAHTLLVDATTTLGFPRDLSECSWAPRSVSVFLTPSGLGSVILLEDSNRKVRLSSLEAQYYREVINSSWGAQHLAGNLSRFSVGASCRDISMALSPELTEFHAAHLARQIRKRVASPDAEIVVTNLNDSDGSLVVNKVEVSAPIIWTCQDWSVAFDAGLSCKARSMRERALPFETGGIIVGYFDLKIRRLTVVDILDAPADSQATHVDFVRGKVGCLEALNEIRVRTANTVDYLGEWHSHPDGARNTPSQEDLGALTAMGFEITGEGGPYLMLIVGQSDISPYVITRKSQANNPILAK